MYTHAQRTHTHTPHQTHEAPLHTHINAMKTHAHTHAMHTIAPTHATHTHAHTRLCVAGRPILGHRPLQHLPPCLPSRTPCPLSSPHPLRPPNGSRPNSLSHWVVRRLRQRPRRPRVGLHTFLGGLGEGTQGGGIALRTSMAYQCSPSLQLALLQAVGSLMRSMTSMASPRTRRPCTRMGGCACAHVFGCAVRVCVCTDVCKHVCKYVCVYVCVCAYLCTFVCMYGWTDACMCMRVPCARIYTYMYVYVCVGTPPPMSCGVDVTRAPDPAHN